MHDADVFPSAAGNLDGGDRLRRLAQETGEGVGGGTGPDSGSDGL